MRKGFMSAAKKAQIALAVLAVVGCSFVGSNSVFAAAATYDIKSGTVSSTGTNNVAIGSSSKANADNDKSYSTAVGDTAIANAANSTAVGYKAQSGEDATAVGANSSASGNNSIAFGGSANAAATNSIAVGKGSGVDASATGSIALGNGSKVTAEDATVTDGDNTTATQRVLSLGNGSGSDETTTKIIHVTAGVNDTDGVNVSQLIKSGSIGTGTGADEGKTLLNFYTQANPTTTGADADTPAFSIDVSDLAGSKFTGTGLYDEITSDTAAGGYAGSTGIGDDTTNANGKGTVVGAINSAYNAATYYTDVKVGDKETLANGNVITQTETINVDDGQGGTKPYIYDTTVNENLKHLDTALGATQADNGNVISKYGTDADGKVTGTANGNIAALDKALGAMRDANGNVISKYGTDADGKVTGTVNDNITALDDALGTMQQEAGNVISAYTKDADGNVTGGTVSSNIAALDNALGKANELSDAENGIKDKDGVVIGQKANEDAEGPNYAGTVTGAIQAVNDKVGDLAANDGQGNAINYNYIEAGNTVNNNLTALDKVLGAPQTAGNVIKASGTDGNGNAVGTVTDNIKALDDALGNVDGLKNTIKDKDGNALDEKKQNVAGYLEALNDKISNSDAAAIDKMNTKLDKLGTRLDKVGAGAAALAALHPMDFDPDDKLTFAAGVGNYNGENAVAVGAFYRPDEKVMFSVAGNMGNGENMVNAGVSFALDRTSRVTNSRTAMAHEIVDLRGQVADMTAKMAKMEAMLGVIDETKTKLFPDVPANHWAYEYVAKLAGNGYIEGYPDGNFAGDRLMTRYEFAAVLYRAIEKGAALEERIINEFAPELGRIRVDRISGEDSDRSKIERVRVNGPKTERDHYGSKLH